MILETPSNQNCFIPVLYYSVDLNIHVCTAPNLALHRLVSAIAACLCNIKIEPVHDISNNVVCATSKASDQPAHTRSLIRVFASRLSFL